MKDNKEIEYLNTFRFLAVLWIVFAHFNYEIFNKSFSFNIFDNYLYNKESFLYYIFYGVTGKYALSMMCIISGLIVAKKNYKKTIDIGKYIFFRYLRLTIPIFVVCTIYVLIMLGIGENIPVSYYLSSVFGLGKNGINAHLGYIFDFFIGNILIVILNYLFSNNKYYLLSYVLLIVLLLLIGKIWISSIVLGGLSYYLCKFIKEKNLYKYWYLLIVIPIIWWLPRGEEGDIIYLRDSLASMLIIITVYCFSGLQKVFNLYIIKGIKKISYSLFITHGLVNNLLCGYIIQFFRNVYVINNVYLFECLVFLIVLIIDLIIAYIIYYISEYKLTKLVNNYIENNINKYTIKLKK